MPKTLRVPVPSARSRRRPPALLSTLLGTWLLVGLQPGQPAAAPSSPPAATPVTPQAAATGDEARVQQQLDVLLGEYLRFHPTHATALGLHERDGELEDFSPAGRAAEEAWLRRWQAQLAGTDLKRLSVDGRLDVQLVQHWLGKRLFELVTMQTFRRVPSVYVRHASYSVNALLKREYGTPEGRLRSLLQRLARIPGHLALAPQLLDRMSKISVEIALRELPSTARFFEVDVPLAFPAVKDPALLGPLKERSLAVAAAIRRYTEWLQTEGRAKAKAEFALGPELFKQKLWADEMIDTPLDELLQRSEAELRRLQNEFRATAARIDKKRSPEEVHLDVLKDHPPASEVIRETAARLGRIRGFLVDRGIVTIPSPVLPQIKETPPFMRATTLASMDTPGPFEQATEAYYYVTLPEPSFSAAEAEDFLRGAYSRPLIDVVTIHEAYPGHYTQFLFGPRLTKARKFFGVASNSEGWAHYTEQMVLDEGYGAGDAKLRLSQLQDALLRAARYVAALRMHTRGMSYEQAVDLFHKDGFQTRQVAELEARRGTQDPMFMAYTYGKLEIYRLRDEYKRKLGPRFTLRGFHDSFLGYGHAPLKLVREAMLATP
ncbi:MAG: DUF885 domain-containing protein [Polyangia bacterium]